MIFLKKILSAAAFFTAFSLILCGCSMRKGSDKKSEKAETTSQPFTEREVEEADGVFVFDNAGVLDPAALKACNDYAGWLYKEKLMNTAVVTVNDLGGKAPYDYAAEKFNELYGGKGSGLVVLINNDTNADAVFRSGACLYSVEQKEQDDAVYWSTKEIFRGDYRAGVMRLLQLGELCPMHIIDNSQALEWDQITKLEKSLSECKTEATIIVSHNNSDVSNEDVLKQYYSRKYKYNSGIMFMLDTTSGKIIAQSGDKLSSDLEKVLRDANALSSKGDYMNALTKITDHLGKE